MSEMVERAAAAIKRSAAVNHIGVMSMGDAHELANDALKAFRELDPHVAARAADRLGIHPSDVTRLVGTWSILIDEALK